MLLPKAFDLLRGNHDGTNIAIVLVPLTSLIEDQVASCISHDITAVAVSREESQAHMISAIRGDY